MMARDLSYYMELSYPIEIVEDQDGFFASHPDLPGCVADGNSLLEAKENLDVARELWIKTRLGDDLAVPLPFDPEEASGKLVVRMPPSLHAAMQRSAQREDRSLNQLLVTAVSQYQTGLSLSEMLRERLERLESAITSLREEVRTLVDRPGLYSEKVTE